MKQKTVLVGVLTVLVLVLVGLVVSQLKGTGSMTAVVPPAGSAVSTSNQASSTSPTVAVSPTPATGAVRVANPITLTVTSPTTNATVTNPVLIVKGRTLPKAEVYVNDSYTTADAAGSFSVNLTLEEGENPVIVVANDADGNMAEAELTVTYDSGK